MEELQRIYRESLAVRVAELEAGLLALQKGMNRLSIEAVQRTAHTLKGSGGTYGFPEITSAADAVGTVDPANLIAAVEDLIAVLIEVRDGG